MNAHIFISILKLSFGFVNEKMLKNINVDTFEITPVL